MAKLAGVPDSGYLMYQFIYLVIYLFIYLFIYLRNASVIGNILPRFRPKESGDFFKCISVDETSTKVAIFLRVLLS